MTRKEFCDIFWNYYLILENDFLKTERYVDFDFGDNNLYANKNAKTIGKPKKYKKLGNSLTFSVEYVKQYQTICSEIDVILKAICKEIKKPGQNDIVQYTNTILEDPFWDKVINQKVKLKNFELQPFINWSKEPWNSPDWWTPYNEVKHNRTRNYKEANLKNVANALAGLYILEMYLVKYIADRDKTQDIPNDKSKLFEMVGWETQHVILGKDISLQLIDK